MTEDEFFDEEGCEEERVGHVNDDVPPYRFSWRLLLADWLDNTGDIIEHLAEYPKAAVRRIWAHEQHRESRRLFAEEAAREIEQLTEGTHAST